ncbi:MAG: glycosyltransferase N-terminal domain-containing protein [Pseudomonadota bacterium]
MTDLRASLWKRAAGLVEPLSDRALQAAIARGEVSEERAQERRGEASVVRPDGPLIWMHARATGRSLELSGIMARLHEEWDDDLTLLLTTRNPVDDATLKRRLPPGVIHQYLPFDRPLAMNRFLDHWRPDVCLWSDAPEAPLLLAEATARRIATTLLCGDEHPAWTARRMRSRLRQFTRVFAPDTPTLAALREAGVSSSAAMMTGEPREDAAAPEVHEVERQRIFEALEARMVWLAAGIPAEELAQILEAQKLATRQVPRLALLLLPEEGAAIDPYIDALNQSGLNWQHASDLRRGGVLTDVVLSDRRHGDGMWYHLAAVTFLGASLVRHGGQSPLSAVALGSAVISGPHVGYYSDLYEQLKKAGAAQMITDAESLADAVSSVVVPETSAQMAHAAWQMFSAGAEAADLVVEELIAMLSDAQVAS